MSGLRPQQENLLSVVSDEWLRVGLCTEPADRPAAGHSCRMLCDPWHEIVPCGIDDRRGTGS